MKKLTKLTALILCLVLLTGAFGYVGIVSGDSEKQASVKTGKRVPEDARIYKAYPKSNKLQVKMKPGLRLCLSSNSKVAKVGWNGNVTTGKVGLAKIDVYRLSKKNRHDTFYIKVANKQRLQAEKPYYKLTYKDPSFLLNVVTNSKEGNRMKYRTKDDSVVKVTKEGKVKVRGAGSTQIIVTATESRSFHQGTLYIPVTVEKKAPNLKAKKDAFEMSVTAEGEKIQLRSDSKGAYKYKSKDISVAEVSKNGKITPKGEGKTTIVIIQKETKNYTKAKKTVSVTVTRPTASDRALAAVAWARKIAADNSFAYGTGHTAHRGGCYFCGTNKWKKGKGYEKTYCCNPFIFAAYAHGAQIPSVLRSCQKGGCGGMEPSDWTPHGFVTLGTTKEVRAEDLLPGDVIISDHNKNGWYHHVWMVCENNQYVEAGRAGWDAGSIAVHDNMRSNYAMYAKHNGCYVMRYQGN